MEVPHGQQFSNICPNRTNNVCGILTAIRGCDNDYHILPNWCEARCDSKSGIKQYDMAKCFAPALPAPPNGVDLLEWITKCVADGTIKVKGPKRQETKKKLPPKFTMVKNLANFAKDAAVKWITDGKIRCCAEQSALRWQECQKCPHMTMIKGKERCATFPGDEKDAGCGCFLRSKIKYAASRCKYWNYIDKQYEVQD